MTTPLVGSYAHLKALMDGLLSKADEAPLTFEVVAEYAVAHPAPWKALEDLLAVLRDQNAKQGGNDRQLALTICLLLGQLCGSIPMVAGETP